MSDISKCSCPKGSRHTHTEYGGVYYCDEPGCGCWYSPKVK